MGDSPNNELKRHSYYHKQKSSKDDYYYYVTFITLDEPTKNHDDEEKSSSQHSEAKSSPIGKKAKSTDGSSDAAAHARPQPVVLSRPLAPAAEAKPDPNKNDYLIIFERADSGEAKQNVTPPTVRYFDHFKWNTTWDKVYRALHLGVFPAHTVHCYTAKLIATLGVPRGRLHRKLHKHKAPSSLAYLRDELTAHTQAIIRSLCPLERLINAVNFDKTVQENIQDIIGVLETYRKRLGMMSSGQAERENTVAWQRFRENVEAMKHQTTDYIKRLSESIKLSSNIKTLQKILSSRYADTHRLSLDRFMQSQARQATTALRQANNRISPLFQRGHLFKALNAAEALHQAHSEDRDRHNPVTRYAQFNYINHPDYASRHFAFDLSHHIDSNEKVHLLHATSIIHRISALDPYTKEEKQDLLKPQLPFKSELGIYSFTRDENREYRRKALEKNKNKDYVYPNAMRRFFTQLGAAIVRLILLIPDVCIAIFQTIHWLYRLYQKQDYRPNPLLRTYFDTWYDNKHNPETQLYTKGLNQAPGQELLDILLKYQPPSVIKRGVLWLAKQIYRLSFEVIWASLITLWSAFSETLAHIVIDVKHARKKPLSDTDLLALLKKSAPQRPPLKRGVAINVLRGRKMPKLTAPAMPYQLDADKPNCALSVGTRITTNTLQTLTQLSEDHPHTTTIALLLIAASAGSMILPTGLLAGYHSHVTGPLAKTFFGSETSLKTIASVSAIPGEAAFILIDGLVGSVTDSESLLGSLCRGATNRPELVAILTGCILVSRQLAQSIAVAASNVGQASYQLGSNANSLLSAEKILLGTDDNADREVLDREQQKLFQNLKLKFNNLMLTLTEEEKHFILNLAKIRVKAKDSSQLCKHIAVLSEKQIKNATAEHPSWLKQQMQGFTHCTDLIRRQQIRQKLLEWNTSKKGEPSYLSRLSRTDKFHIMRWVEANHPKHPGYIKAMRHALHKNNKYHFGPLATSFAIAIGYLPTLLRVVFNSITVAITLGCNASFRAAWMRAATALGRKVINDLSLVTLALKQLLKYSLLFLGTITAMFSRVILGLILTTLMLPETICRGFSKPKVCLILFAGIENKVTAIVSGLFHYIGDHLASIFVTPWRHKATNQHLSLAHRDAFIADTRKFYQILRKEEKEKKEEAKEQKAAPPKSVLSARMRPQAASVAPPASAAQPAPPASTAQPEL